MTRRSSSNRRAPAITGRKAAGGLGLLVTVALGTGLYGHQVTPELRAAMAAESHGIAADGENYLWRPVAIGGGGFMTGIGGDASGSMRVARSDVYGAYIWIPAKDLWVQLVNSDSMPGDLLVQDGGNEGVFEIVVAPSAPNRIYMAFKGSIYRSDNGGRKFVAVPPVTPPTTLAFDANSPSRQYGPVMAVGTADPDLVFFGSPNNGFWRSEDAGRHWTRIATVPYQADPTNPGARPGMPIWIRRAANGSQNDVVWVMSPGSGMFVSANSGLTFLPLIARGGIQPGSLKQGAFTRQGTFLGVDDVRKTVWRYRDGAWTDLAAKSRLTHLVYATLAVDPSSFAIYLFDEGGELFRSTDDGLSWTRLPHSAGVGDTDPPWLHVSDKSYFAISQVRFDLAVPHRLWAGTGTGIYYADLPPSARSVRWTSQTRGIEALVANDVIHPQGRSPLFAGWDFGIHLKPDLNAFSSTYGPKERVLIAAQQLDASPADPDFIVTNASDTRTGCCSEDGDAVLAGFSRDGGITWSKFATLPHPPGTATDDPWRMSFGSIAVSANDTRNIIWQPTNNRSPFYTKNRGASWERVKLTGERLPNTGSHAVYSFARKNLAADRLLPGVFYLFHSGEADNVPLKGLWRTDDGGIHWRKVYSGEIAPSSAYSAKLRAVPGNSGHLFFTSGVSKGSDMALRRSTDGGASWQVLSDVQRVDDIAFGKAVAGGYPTIFLSGQIRKQYGIWRSTDNAVHWVRVAAFPVGTLDQVTSIGADPDSFGRVYVGYKGSGWRYGEPSKCTATPYRFPDDAECFRVH